MEVGRKKSAATADRMGRGKMGSIDVPLMNREKLKPGDQEFERMIFEDGIPDEHGSGWEVF